MSTLLQAGTIIVAPFIGSFLAVLAMRLPEQRPVVLARSACDLCRHPLTASDLVPLMSWAWLGGRCRYCGAKISEFYLFMEVVAVAVVIWAATITSDWIFVVTCLFGWVLLTLAAVDWRSYLLPDIMTFPLLIAGLAVAYLIDAGALMDHVIGAAAGFVIFVAIANIYRYIRGHDGLGYGDAKTLAALGAWVSWSGLPTTILFAAMMGLGVVLIRSFMGKRIAPTDRFPFGTYLAVAGWLVWLYGPLMPA